MSQRRQDARRAKQEREREARRRARTEQQRRTTTTTSGTAPTARPTAGARPAGARPAGAAATTATRPAPAGPGFWTKRNKLLVGGGVAAVIVAAIAFWIIQSVTAPLPGTRYESLGNEHLTNATDPHPPYNSNPPTSGWHLPPIPRPGIYRTAYPPEGLGHFMEHGGVWVLYNCPDESCPEDVERLTDIVNSAIDRNRPVALAPFPTMEVKFATVAWQYLQTWDEVNKGEVEEFINRHSCRYNPEGAGYCPTVRGKLGTPPPDVMDRTSTATAAAATATSVFFTPTNTPAPAATPTPAPAGTATSSP